LLRDFGRATQREAGKSGRNKGEIGMIFTILVSLFYFHPGLAGERRLKI